MPRRRRERLLPERSWASTRASPRERTWRESVTYSLTNRPLLQLGARARLGLPLGRVRPAIIGGLALYRGTVTNLGYSVGGEVEVRVTEWLPLAIDARFHDSLHNFTYESDREKRYVSVGLGWRRSW